MHTVFRQAATAMFALVALATASSLRAQAVLEGAAEDSTIDCGGGTAQVTGTSNAVTWRTLGKAVPKTSSTGFGNSIKRVP